MCIQTLGRQTVVVKDDVVSARMLSQNAASEHERATGEAMGSTRVGHTLDPCAIHDLLLPLGAVFFPGCQTNHLQGRGLKVLIWTNLNGAAKIQMFTQHMLPVWKGGGATAVEPDKEQESPLDGTQWRWGRELTAYRPLELAGYLPEKSVPWPGSKRT